MKKIFNQILRVVIVSLVLLSPLSAAFANSAHTVQGIVNSASTSTPWKFYVAARPSETLTGNLVGSGPWAYQALVGNLPTQWAAGDDGVVVIWRADNAAAINHTGYYAVVNAALISTSPQTYPTATLSAIPAPTATANAVTGKVDLVLPATITNIIGYNIYRGTDGINFSKINSGIVSTTTYSDPTGTAGQTYYYAIEIVYKSNIVAGSGTPILSANSNSAVFPTPVVTLSSIAITPTAPSILAGGTQQFTATGTYSDNSTANITSQVTWNSSNAGVAGINISGLATGASAGTSNITASLSGKSSNPAILTVTSPVTLTSITLAPALASIVVSASQQYTATGHYSDGSSSNITSLVSSWNSSSTATAAINSSGLASAVAAGSTNITATYNGVTSFNAVLTVSAPTLSISTAWDNSTGNNATAVGFAYGQINISAASGSHFGANPGNGNAASTLNNVKVNGQTVTDSRPGAGVGIYYWSDNLIQVGIAPSSALAAGPLTIQVTANGAASNVDATKTLLPRLWNLSTTEGTIGSQVTVNGESLGATPANVTVLFNGTAATATAANNTTATVTVPSGASSGLVTVEVNGQKSNSNYVINNGAAYGDPIIFTVKSAITLTSLAITPAVVTVNPSQTAQFAATGNYSDGSTANLTSQVTWNSATPSVATINGAGLATAVAVGSSNITAAFNGLTSNVATLTVSPASVTPTIESVNPSPALTGQTIVLAGSNFGPIMGGKINLLFTNDFSIIQSVLNGAPVGDPTKVFSAAATTWSDTKITSSIPSGLTAGTAYVLVARVVSSTEVHWAYAPVQVSTQAVVIDDFEGGGVGNFATPDPDSGYYTFGEGITPNNSAINSDLKKTESKYQGTYGADVTYSFPTGSAGFGGGWGATLANKLNLSGANVIGLYVKGDGSNNQASLKLRALDSQGKEVVLVSPVISLRNAGYTLVNLKLSDFTTETSLGATVSQTVDPNNLKQIVGYNLVYNTKLSSLTEHWIDYLAAYTTSEAQPTGEVTVISVTPAAAPAGARAVVNYVSGKTFGATQGRSQVLFTNQFGATRTDIVITRWSDTTIEVTVPNLTAGNYQVSVFVVPAAAGVGAFETNTTGFQLTASGVVEQANVYPNPFNAGTEVTNIVIVNAGGAANIGYYIYDMTARLVSKQIVSANQVTWNGYDQYNALVGDGAYLLRVVNEDNKSLIAKGKILVVKR